MKLISINYLFLIGSIFTKGKEEMAEMVGFLVHLGASMIIALIYAMIFSVFHVSGWGPVALLALIHLAISSTAVLILAVKKQSFRKKLLPDLRYNHYVYDIIIFVVLHFVFGVTNGILFHIA